MTIDPKKNPGSRIQEILFNGQFFDLDAYYTVSSTTFIRNGGDGYNSLKKGFDVENKENGMLLSMIFEEHLKKFGKIGNGMGGLVTYK
jgi:5'-nucleotidase/UDP-sugar diphosphatase